LSVPHGADGFYCFSSGEAERKAMFQTDRPRQWAQAAVVAAGLTAATVIVAIAGRAPLSRSAPVNAASAQAPTTALLVFLAGAGVVALGVLAALMWPGRRSKSSDEPEPPPPPAVHWIWKLLALLLPIALGAALVAAAVLGAKPVHHPARVVRSIGTLRPRAAVARGGRTFVLPPWLPWTILAILAIAIALVGLMLLVRHRAGAGDAMSERIAAEAAVRAAIGALDVADDPRSAVIAAYAAMEHTLATHGIKRARAEAPREYLRRVLQAASGAERDARTLTSLFEEARFSTHPIPERVRQHALDALSSLRNRLAVTGTA
jgi:hypothetical protein